MQKFVGWVSHDVMPGLFRFFAALPFTVPYGTPRLTPRDWNDWACILEGNENQVPKERRDALRVKVNGPQPEAAAQ